MKKLLFLCVILLLAPVYPAAALETDSTLICWYTLDNQATDNTVFGNNGTIFNLVTAPDRFGNQDGALEFNGANGYISIPTSASLASPDSMITMSAWIYMYGWSRVGTDFNPVLMKSADGSNVFQYRLSIGPAGIGAHFNNWNTGFNAPYSFRFYDWYMVTVTYDSDSLRYYVNGAPAAVFAFNEKMVNDARPLEIGRDVPGITELFYGRIDDVRIYNRALPEEEINILYDKYHQQAQIFTPIEAFPDSGSTAGSYAVIWGDFNNDDFSLPGLFLTTAGDSNMLFDRDFEGQFIRNYDSQAILSGASSRSAAWADYDNDGDLDLVVIRFSQKNILYENSGDGTFTEQTGSPVSELSRSSTDAAWGDYDGDSWLDLIVTNRDQANELYHNNGDGSFTRIDTGVVATDNRSSITPTWIDIDEDGDLDLYITNTFFQNNFVYMNHGDGYFTRNDTIAIANDGQHSSSPSWGDFDNDGDFDLFVSNTNSPGDNNFLYRNDGSGTFNRLTNVPMANDKGASAGSCWGDVDNDGDIDLAVANGENIVAAKNFIYLNKGNGEFERLIGEPAVEDAGQSDGISLTDWDEDGALELLVANRDRNCAAYDNVNARNWVKVSLFGTESNRSAIGAVVRVKANIYGLDTWQTRLVASNAGRRSANGLVQHFGLGDAERIDSLIVEWPSGSVRIWTNLDANLLHEIWEPSSNAIGGDNQQSAGPEAYALFQNYPNPFNPATTISWQLAAAGMVELEVYDLLGGKVATLVSEYMPAGRHAFCFNGSGLASGIYYYRLNTGTFRQIRKMLLLR